MFKKAKFKNFTINNQSKIRCRKPHEKIHGKLHIHYRRKASDHPPPQLLQNSLNFYNIKYK